MQHIKINGVNFRIVGKSLDIWTDKFSRSEFVLDHDHRRTLADWLTDCCDEMEGVDDNRRPVSGKRVFSRNDYESRCSLTYQCFDDDMAALLISGPCNTQRGHRITADQCDELAKQLRRVARWDRRRRAEAVDKEASVAKAKVEALAKELGADTIIELAKGLQEKGDE